jgi:hypothetical protein
MLAHSITFSDSWPLSMGASVAYGLGDKRWKYSVSATQGLTWTSHEGMNANFSVSSGDVTFSGIKKSVNATSSISVRVFDSYILRGQAYDGFVNTLTALFLHNDYPNYYRARGFAIDYSADLTRHTSLGLSFTNEDDRSLTNVTDYSLLLANNHYRDNPSIDEGRLHQIGGNVSTSFKIGYWDASVNVSMAYADHNIGGEFDYLTGTLGATFEGKTGGWGSTWLKARVSDLFHGALPKQKLFYVESRNAVLAPRDVFRTMSPLEFESDRLWLLMFEQNFYDLPTRLLGITMPTELHWFGFANAAGANMPVLTGPFLEAGFGIGNIFNILRFDAAWRLTQRVEHNFFVTGTLALSF